MLRRVAVTGCIFVFANVCFAAQDLARVSGKVTDETGKPLSGVTWSISAIEEWRDGKWEVVYYTGRTLEHTTAENGQFEVTFHGNQRYDLQFYKWGYGPSFLFQISSDSPELHVIMKPGVLVSGEVEVLGKSAHAFGGEILVSLRLPNPRGLWFKRSTCVDHAGKFRFHAGPPPTIPGLQEVPKWQVVCAGEVVTIDVEENTPVDQVIFEIEVTSKRRPSEDDKAHTE
jgi:hypothetical protein